MVLCTNESWPGPCRVNTWSGYNTHPLRMHSPGRGEAPGLCWESGRCPAGLSRVEQAGPFCARRPLPRNQLPHNSLRYVWSEFWAAAGPPPPGPRGWGRADPPQAPGVEQRAGLIQDRVPSGEVTEQSQPAAVTGQDWGEGGRLHGTIVQRPHSTPTLPGLTLCPPPTPPGGSELLGQGLYLLIARSPRAVPGKWGRL